METLVSLLLAALAAVLGYLFGRRQQKDLRRDRRRDLATALVTELRYLEGILRAMARDERPLDSMWYLPTQLSDRLLPEVRIFDVEAYVSVYEFYGIVAEIRSRLTLGRGLIEITPRDHGVIRAKAHFALEELGQLVEHLRRSGAAPLPAKELRELDPRGPFPELPEPVFPELAPDGRSFDY